jgi:hypothetical protein
MRQRKIHNLETARARDKDQWHLGE